MRDEVFSPAFGNRPSQLVGRDSVLDELVGGLTSRPGNRRRATVLLGQRGMGKTVLLWELADRARELGYAVATPTVVSESMLDRIVEKIQDDGERYIKQKHGQLVGGSVGVLGFSAGLQFSEQVQETKSFGYKILSLARELGEQGHGLLILVDELQANSPELKQLLISYAELVGEQQNMAIVLAGLPAAVSSMLNDHVLTFLNRANKVILGPIEQDEIDAYYARVFEGVGLRVDPGIRRSASAATFGSPYMMQLVGHNLMRYAGETGVVTHDVLQNALVASREAFEEDVCQTTLAALSERDADFLQAMSSDKESSRMSDIAKRMGVTDDYAQKYRKRLLANGIIEAPRRGFVRFAVPYLAGYLRRNAE